MPILKNLFSKNRLVLWIFSFWILTFSSSALAISVTTYSPTDNSTSVTPSQNLVLTMDQSFNFLNDNFTIYNSGGTIFEQYSVSYGDTANVSGQGTNTLTINPSTNFVTGNSYYINIGSYAMSDLSYMDYYSGISDNTTWNFTVSDTTKPTVSSFTPADGTTKVLTGMNLTIVFDEAIDIRTGNVTIKNASGDTVVETIAVNSAKVTGNGTTTIVINPSNGLTAGANLYVQIDNGAFYDLYGNDFDGISNTTTWNFSTWDSTVNWYNSSWLYRIKVKVLHSKVNGDLADFPVMVNLNNLGSDFFSHVKSDGTDIVVTDYTGNGTKLSRELESINTSAQSGILWFKAPNLYNNVNGDFYIYYGYNSASETNSTSTWKSSYQQVSHFTETPTASDADSEFQDSTTNNKDGKSKGTMGSTNKKAGQIGNGIYLDGSNDYLDYGNISAIDTKPKASFSTWFKRTNTSSTLPIFNKGSTTSVIDIYENTTTYKLTEDDINNYHTVNVTPNTNWHYMVAVLDGSTTGNSNRFKFYVDGTAQSLSYANVGSNTGGESASLYVGYRYDSMNWPYTSYAGATFDEIHISNGTFSAAWIKTEYDNQYSPSTFYTASAEETGGPDTTDPTVSSFSPTDGTTEALISTNLVINFSEAVATQTGNITIKKSSDNSTIETIAVSSGQVTGNGTAQITINPSSDLNYSTGYYVQIDTTAFDDTAGNSYAGIANNTTWNFTTGAWYSNNWSNRIKITINAAYVDADLTNFPVYVNLDDLPDSFFDIVKTAGADIRVTKSDGSTEVAREVVALSKTANTGELWFVANGTLSGSTNTDFYIYYGNNSASEPAEDASYGRENVWVNDYVAVHHLNEDGNNTASGYNDATSKDNDGTGVSMTASSDVTGKIGLAQDFDGSADYISMADSPYWDFASNGFTLEAWVKGDVYGSSMAPIGRWEYNSGNYRRWLMYATSGSKISWGLSSDGTDGGRVLVDGTTTLSTGTWYHAVGVRDGNTIRTYLNGIQESTGSFSSAIPNDSIGVSIGRMQTSANGSNWNGVVDEVRISNITRSATWVSTEYNNQSAPSTFYSVGSVEAGGAADTTDPTISSFSPADNATGVAVNANLVMNFDESISVQSGNINIYTGAGTLFESLAVGSGNVTGTGTSSITINPSSDFANARAYYVLIDSTAFDDASGNSYAGVGDPSTWNFITVASGGGDVTGPSVSYFSPPDNAHFIQSYSGITMIFDEAVQAGSGSVRIKRSSDNAVLDTISVNSANITGWGTNTVTIKHSASLSNNTSYYVQVDAGAILDLSGNSFSGVSSSSTWNFNTKSTPNSFMGGGL